MAAMARMKDKQFDLAIVDPPFGIGDFCRSTSHGKKIVRNYKRPTWNNSIPLDEYFKELRRVSKHQIIWGANYFNCFSTGGALVWWKNTGCDTLSQCSIASLSFQKKVDYVHINKLGFNQYTEQRIHPCQMPVDLYKWILLKYAPPQATILDTHLGSGSSAIVAYDLGFELTGYETDVDHFNDAVDRLENHSRQERFI